MGQLNSMSFVCWCRRRFDFQGRMDGNVEMFMQIQKSLVQTRVMIQPAIFLRPDIDKITTVKLKDIVKRHLGVVVDKASDATHIVYPQPNARDEGILFVSDLKLNIVNIDY